MKDYYNILGVNKNASSFEIKKKFRKRALLVHPDKSNQYSKEVFIELYEAFEILKDEKKRKKYDKVYFSNMISTEVFNFDLKLIINKAEEYSNNFKKFNKEVIFDIVFELFFSVDYLLFASLLTLVFGIWTLIKGFINIDFEYGLIGLFMILCGLILSRIKINKIIKDAR